MTANARADLLRIVERVRPELREDVVHPDLALACDGDLQITFVVWIAFRLLTPVLATVPQGPMLLLGLNLIVFVFFNAVPELIYLGRCSSLELLGQSYAFIGENWIEWFPATFALAGLMLVVAALPLPGAKLALVALLVAYAMVVRGLLFLELHGSSRRSRAFRHRMGR